MPEVFLSLRIDLASGGRIGPGKIALLESVADHGSISAAARALGMSYKRAWDLVEETGRIMGAPMVAAQAGGKQGGGAKLTIAGQRAVERFRRIETAAAEAAAPMLDDLKAEIAAQSLARST
jgi:molybdate transport system regulatory protein